MDRAVNLIARVFGFLFVGGDFWQRLLSNEKVEDEEKIVAKRYQFMTILCPIVFTFRFIMVWTAVVALVIASSHLLLEIEATREITLQVTNYFSKLGERWNGFFDSFDGAVRDLLGWFSCLFPYNFKLKVSAIFIYIISYRIEKKKIEESLISKSEYLIKVFPSIHDVIENIYIVSPGTGKVALSSKWSQIKKYLSLFIIVNFVLIFYIDMFGNVWTKEIWNFAVAYLGSIMGFFCLLEAYRYLSLADTRRNQHIPNGTLNLIKLRLDYQKYAHKNRLSVSSEYKRKADLVDEIQKNAEDSSMGTDNATEAFLYEYLANKGQMEHIDMALRLVRGENIFYASPFYKDIDGCIFFLILQTLLRQKKSLILIEDNGSIEEIRQWIKDGIESVSGIKKLADVEVLKDCAIKAEVGILPFQNISNVQVMGELNSFLAEVSFAVVLKASGMLAGGQEMIITLAERLRRGNAGCTWLLCDWNAESMLDLFGHLLSADFVYVNATPVGAKEVVTSYWNTETEPDCIWDPARRYLGLEMGIMEVAGRNQLSQMTLYGEEWIPVFDMQWIIGQYYQLYSKKVVHPMSQKMMNLQIQCNIPGEAYGIEPEGFFVIEDSFCNLYEVGRQYVARARDRAYIHVLSPNYLLRDFMKSESDTMNFDAKYIAQFVPEYINSTRNVYLHLLRRLLEESVSKKEIYMSLIASDNFYELNQETNTNFIIRDKIEEITNVLFGRTIRWETDIEVTMREVFSEQEECTISEYRYRIINKDIRHIFYKYFRQARYLNEMGEKHYINHLMLAGHLELKYLPGQYVTLNGKYYQVEQLLDSDKEILLVVRRASDRVIDRCYYRQLRTYKFEKSETPFSSVVFEQDGIRVIRQIIDFKAQTTGYLTIRKRWNDFRNAQRTSYESAERIYVKKRVLRVEIYERNIDWSELLYLAAVIHEMFYTFYPQYCYLLSVAVCEQYTVIEEGRYRGVLAVAEECTGFSELNKKNYFYIIEDSCEDMGLLQSIECHFHQILQIAAEYINWAEASDSYFGEK